MFHLAICLSAISLAYAAVSEFPDPADVDPLTVLIKEIKNRMHALSQDIENDIAVLEKARNSTHKSDFPQPKPLFDGIFSPQQLDKIEKSGLQGGKNLDHRAKVLVDRLLFLNERGVDITGPAGGYHRSLGGGYMAPHQYEPANVLWQSYRDEGRSMNDMDEFGRIV